MIRFVLATIQQHLEAVPDIIASFEELGAGSPFAFGSKRRGLTYLHENMEAIYWDAMCALDDDEQLMSVFLRVPGLGLVKAGFACQLFAGRVGCLDVHNIRMYDIPMSVLRYSKKSSVAALEKNIRIYTEMCHRLGGPVTLWGRWCEYKADVSPSVNWPAGAESVSVLHVEACSGSWWHTLPQFMLFDEQPRFRPDEGLRDENYEDKHDHGQREHP